MIEIQNMRHRFSSHYRFSSNLLFLILIIPVNTLTPNYIGGSIVPLIFYFPPNNFEEKISLAARQPLMTLAVKAPLTRQTYSFNIEERLL